MAATRPTSQTAHTPAYWVLQGVRFFLYLALVPAALFLSAGRLDWGMGWTVFGVMLAATLVSRLLVARANPDLLQERASAGERGGVPDWDRWLVRVIGLAGPVAIAVVAGLDLRFGWSPALPLMVVAAAIGVLIGGYALSTWAMASNPFFSAYVRIQTDRGHTVVSRGPYQWLRHPGYAGGVLGDIAVPLALGSLWALIPGAVTIAVMVLRTALEDRTLRAQLPGYKEYAEKVRYRLLPGLW